MPEADPSETKGESHAATSASAGGPDPTSPSAHASSPAASPADGSTADPGAIPAEKQQKKQKQQKQQKQQKPADGQGDHAGQHQGQPRPPKQPKPQKPPGDQTAAGTAADHAKTAKPDAEKSASAGDDKDAKDAKDAKDGKDAKDADGKKDGAADPATAPTGLAARLRAKYLAKILGKVAMAREIAGLPWVTIATGREPAGREIYRFLAANHLTWPLIPSKCLGVALLKLPADHAGYLAGKSRQALRTNITRTKKAGFTCRMFDPFALHGQILAIYRSTPERQGHAVDFQAGPFAQMMADRPERFYGIFDKDDVLKGFACPTITGEMGWTRVFIGHNDDLRTGIMYALMSYLIQELIAERDRRGHPIWLMYDFWYGKSEGMRYFIQLCGFTPHNVHWHQAHIPPEHRAPTDDWQRWECG